MANSMTAFARIESQNNFGSLVWEIRSLNHRFLDIFLRLPENFRQLENDIRSKIKNNINRGKLDASLYFIQDVKQQNSVDINEEILKSVAESLSRAGNFLGAHQQVNLMDVLAWPGVIKEAEIDTDALSQEALNLLEQTIISLVKARAQEGAKLQAIVKQKLKLLKPLIEKAKVRVPETISNHRQKLKSAMDELKLKVDNERLDQEIALLIQKMDISEELDRLSTHVEEVNNVFNKTEPIGRRLDFLMQELHREANTLGSKSQDSVTTSLALEMKVIIEQMREQVQNIE